MDENAPSPSEGAPGKSQPGLKIPDEVEKILNAAIKSSIDKALQEVGPKLPATREQALVDRVSRELKGVVQKTVLASYQGPIPPPQMLAAFEEIVPGLAQQLVSMTLNEQHHRHRWENRALLNDIFLQSGGLALGWMLAGASLLGAYFLGMKGNNAGMGIMLGVPAIQMIRSVINGGQTNKAKFSQPASAAKPTFRKRRS